MTSIPQTQMRDSWLVQRLSKPTRGHSLFGKDNPFAFGGGLRNGGLTSEAMDLLRDIFAFEYMGSAEFEFGAVPEALNRLAKADLIAFELTVPLSSVPPSWDAPKDAPTPTGSASVYVICQTAEKTEVTNRVMGFARGNGRTKESVDLTSTLRPVEKWDRRTVGWLEISNGYFFFTDEQMFSATASLFAVEVQS